jgi:hypothetical protein
MLPQVERRSHHLGVLQVFQIHSACIRDPTYNFLKEENKEKRASVIDPHTCIRISAGLPVMLMILGGFLSLQTNADIVP